MTHINTLIPPDDLAAALDAGHVTRKQHPTLPLSIYTYTRACQYEGAWTAVTTRCRGLIADDLTYEILAWPFPKFFNVAEHDQGRPYAPPLPDEPFEVHDKVDGSLGIVFHYDGRWHAASKGSFISEQATWAQAWLDDHDTSALWPGTTYLAEIVYPENRIVVDYGARRDLVLLAAYRPDGSELALAEASVDWLEIGSVVRTWPAMELAELLKFTEENTTPDGRHTVGTDAEGYVIRYASGLRAKAKLAEYVRLHKVLTGITARDIWRYFGVQLFADQPPKMVAKALYCPVAEVEAFTSAEKGPLDALLEQVPDEFDAWVRDVVLQLTHQILKRQLEVDVAYNSIAHLAPARAQFARAAQQLGQRLEDQTITSAMFLRLDGRPTDLLVYRSLRPAASDPFKTDEEG